MPTDCYSCFSTFGVDMQPLRPSPLQRSHPFLSSTYMRSVFEDRCELLGPSVRGTPSSTTHREGLLLRVGSLAWAPTYNRGVVHNVVLRRRYAATAAAIAATESSIPANLHEVCFEGRYDFLRPSVRGTPSYRHLCVVITYIEQ